MADRLYTNDESDDVLSTLRLATRIDKAALARMAFILSLTQVGTSVPVSLGTTGAEIKRPTFVGTDETFLRVLLTIVHGDFGDDEENFFSNKSLIKYHIDYGTALLGKLYEECGKDSDELLSRLVDRVEFNGRKERIGKGFAIFLGKSVTDKTDLMIELNNTLVHANSHMAITGKPGVGKTQFLLKILADIRIQSNYQTNFIYFDYKGDVVDNERFLEITKAQDFRLLQDGANLPINPFMLPDYQAQTVQISAREKAESFASINARLGVVQKGALTDAIRVAYAKRSNSETPYPDFKDVLAIVEDKYKVEEKKADSLVEVLRDLADFNLFWKHGDTLDPIDKLTNRTLLIDLHAMPVLKELVAYLIIERLYKEMVSLPDSPVVDGVRTIRTILAIDEAHNYLNQKNIFLQRIIREGRSKGVVVFLQVSHQMITSNPFSIFKNCLNLSICSRARE